MYRYNCYHYLQQIAREFLCDSLNNVSFHVSFKISISIHYHYMDLQTIVPNSWSMGNEEYNGVK